MARAPAHQEHIGALGARAGAAPGGARDVLGWGTFLVAILVIVILFAFG